MGKTPSTSGRKRPRAERVESRPQSVLVAVAMPATLLRELLARRLGDEAGLELVGCVADCAALAEIVKGRDPRVLLLDREVHADATEHFVRQLRASHPETRVLLLSPNSFDEALERALRAGSAGVVPAQCEYATLVRAIRAVSRGEIWANRRLTAQALERSFDPSSLGTDPECELTEREREIVDAVGRGLRNKEIARRLRISEKTVKNHLSNIFRKLKVDNRFAVGLYSLNIRTIT
jgi:DNA-binding NarL/FixJ family response regulator